MANVLVKQGLTSVLVHPGQGVSWSEDYGCGHGRTTIFWDGQKWRKKEKGWDAVGSSGRSWDTEAEASPDDVNLALLNIINACRAGLPLRTVVKVKLRQKTGGSFL